VIGIIVDLFVVEVVTVVETLPADAEIGFAVVVVARLLLVGAAVTFAVNGCSRIVDSNSVFPDHVLADKQTITHAVYKTLEKGFYSNSSCFGTEEMGHAPIISTEGHFLIISPFPPFHISSPFPRIPSIHFLLPFT